MFRPNETVVLIKNGEYDSLVTVLDYQKSSDYYKVLLGGGERTIMVSSRDLQRPYKAVSSLDNIINNVQEKLNLLVKIRDQVRAHLVATDLQRGEKLYYDFPDRKGEVVTVVDCQDDEVLVKRSDETHIWVDREFLVDRETMKKALMETYVQTTQLLHELEGTPERKNIHPTDSTPEG